MDTTRRAAGWGLLAYAIGTITAIVITAVPGGDYDESQVTGYVARGHWPIAAAGAVLGVLATFGLLPFARHARTCLRVGADAVWAFAVAAVAVAVVGWFAVAGIPIAFAEGGTAVAAVPHAVTYVLSEIANVLAWCGPAFLVGAMAIVVGARSTWPRGIRVLSVLAGLCGMAAAAWFPMFIFVLWALITGVWAIASSPREALGITPQTPTRSAQLI